MLIRVRIFARLDALSKRLSARLFGSMGRSSKPGLPKSQPVSHYVGVLRKKAVTKLDMLGLQEELKAQGPTWCSKVLRASLTEEEKN